MSFQGDRLVFQPGECTESDEASVVSSLFCAPVCKTGDSAATVATGTADSGHLLGRLQERADLIFNILEFLDFKERSSFTGISMGFNKLLNTGFYWKFMCERLADEARLYVADDVFSTVSVDGGWRAFFMSLWKRKCLTANALPHVQ
jgi:hypothetical protein